MDSKGKVVIVTGASSGIGFATARLLAANGAKVVLASRSKDKLDKISSELPGSLAVKCDMTKASDIKNLFNQTMKQFGRVDILVNNAGQGYDAPVEKINIETFRKIFELDVVGPVIAMEEAIPIMRKQGGGSIVNVSSGTALAYWPTMAPYSSMKRALAGISITANTELKADKIAVSVIYPYATLTDFEKNTLKNDVPDEDDDLPFKADTAEHVAERILDAIKSGDAEVFAHDWMKNMGKGK